MKYAYSIVSGQTNIDGRYTKRPIVEIELGRGYIRRRFLALIDSGADHIMMPSAIAEAFGIERDMCPTRRSMGISMEPVDGFVASVSLRLKDMPDLVEVPVVFVDPEIPVLLGREAFFDRYRIKFEQDHDTFEITQAPKR